MATSTSHTCRASFPSCITEVYKTLGSECKTELERREGKKKAKSKEIGSHASWVNTYSIFFNVVARRVLTWPGNYRQTIHTVENQRKAEHSQVAISRKVSKLTVLISEVLFLFLITILNFNLNFKHSKKILVKKE